MRSFGYVSVETAVWVVECIFFVLCSDIFLVKKKNDEEYFEVSPFSLLPAVQCTLHNVLLITSTCEAEARCHVSVCTLAAGWVERLESHLPWRGARLLYPVAQDREGII